MTNQLDGVALAALLTAQDGPRWVAVLADLDDNMRHVLLLHAENVAQLSGRGPRQMLGFLAETQPGRIIERSFRGETPAEIAAAEGLSVGEVHRHLKAGKRDMKDDNRRANASSGVIPRGPGANRMGVIGKHWPQDRDEKAALQLRINAYRHEAIPPKLIADIVGMDRQACANYIQRQQNELGVNFPQVDYTMAEEEARQIIAELEGEAQPVEPVAADTPPPAPAAEPVAQMQAADLFGDPAAPPPPAPTPAPAPVEAEEPKKVGANGRWPSNDLERARLQDKVIKLRLRAVSPSVIAAVTGIDDKAVKNYLDRHAPARGPYPPASRFIKQPEAEEMYRTLETIRGKERVNATPEQVAARLERIIELTRAGKGPTEIGKLLGLSAKRVTEQARVARKDGRLPTSVYAVAAYKRHGMNGAGEAQA